MLMFEVDYVHLCCLNNISSSSSDSLNQTSFGNIWEHLGTFGIIWEHLGTFGNSFARLWHHVCWQVRFVHLPPE